YNYVYVSQVVPQTTTVYSNGAAVYTTPSNTGVAAAPTASGTFPVYIRYTTTTMSGTNPDGSKYVDPGIPWVSYFNGGDALHGFDRSSYGTPQSVGCVEMPPANAAIVYPLTPIGTLVTVS
ncbi:MAG TPA: L,D-transpeptidase, partial [Acidimicrobiales bacterium]|nr:L,D-transpeptidase [Acidimicrobiales bacterium]